MPTHTGAKMFIPSLITVTDQGSGSRVPLMSLDFTVHKCSCSVGELRKGAEVGDKLNGGKI